MLRDIYIYIDIDILIYKYIQYIYTYICIFIYHAFGGPKLLIYLCVDYDHLYEYLMPHDGGGDAATQRYRARGDLFKRVFHCVRDSQKVFGKEVFVKVFAMVFVKVLVKGVRKGVRS